MDTTIKINGSSYEWGLQCEVCVRGVCLHEVGEDAMMYILEIV